MVSNVEILEKSNVMDCLRQGNEETVGILNSKNTSCEDVLDVNMGLNIEKILNGIIRDVEQFNGTMGSAGVSRADRNGRKSDLKMDNKAEVPERHVAEEAMLCRHTMSGSSTLHGTPPRAVLVSS
ncbi:hypothetical protein LWI28_000685 [Acer negundo]|uniref:Uncharacterized protein n=1 Tax=Acer negundo TaxID=4023 RepID=A0AAD5NIE3_ACENE|nr:hypothetical protein LWI28_000685 [Acer negundo]